MRSTLESNPLELPLSISTSLSFSIALSWHASPKILFSFSSIFYILVFPFQSPLYPSLLWSHSAFLISAVDPHRGYTKKREYVSFVFLDLSSHTTYFLVTFKHLQSSWLQFSLEQNSIPRCIIYYVFLLICQMRDI